MLTCALLLTILALWGIGHAAIDFGRPKARPGTQARRRRLALAALGTVFLAALWLGIYQMAAGMKLAGLSVAFGGAGLVFTAVLLARRPKAPAETENYLADPRHCGRCGYDLTGNVSGVCPECGWALLSAHQSPVGNPPHAPTTAPQWTAFCKQWRIQHLESWRTHLSAGLATAVTRSVLLAFLGVNALLFVPRFMDGSSLLTDPGGPVLLFLAVVLLVLLITATLAWIQVIRIASYGHRQRNSS